MRVPTFKDEEVTKFLTQWDMDLQRIQKDNLSAVTGNRSLLLFSPSNKVYEIKVSDAGVISATHVAG